MSGIESNTNDQPVDINTTRLEGQEADESLSVSTAPTVQTDNSQESALTTSTAAPSADGTTTPSISGKAKEMVIDAMKDPKNQEAALNKAGEFMSDPKNQEMAKQGAAAGWSMIKGLGNSFYDRATGKAKKDEEAAAAAAAEQQRLEAEAAAAAAAEQQRLDAEAAAAVPTGDGSTVSTGFTGLDSGPTYAPPLVPGATTGNSVELSINELNDNLEGAKATMMSVDPTTGVLNVAYEDADDAGDSVSQAGDDSMPGGRKTKRRKQIKKNKSQKKKRKQTKKKGGKKKGGKKAKKSNTRKCT